VRITNGSTSRTHQNTLAEGGMRDSIIKIHMRAKQNTRERNAPWKRERRRTTEVGENEIHWLERFHRQAGGQNPGENFQGNFRDLFGEIFREKKNFLLFRQNDSFAF